MIEYLEPLINGILLGGLYGVVGIGLSMVFGIMRQVNLAHGELMILSQLFQSALSSSAGTAPLDYPHLGGAAHVFHRVLHSNACFLTGSCSAAWNRSS